MSWTLHHTVLSVFLTNTPLPFCFQALCSELLEPGEAPPHCDPWANDGSAWFSVLLSNRKVFLKPGYQSAAGNDQPESRLQTKHVWVSTVRVYLPGPWKSAAFMSLKDFHLKIEFVCDWWVWWVFHSLGLCDWFQLALQEYSNDSHVCWNPKLSNPWECVSDAVWKHKGEGPSHSDFIGVQPNSNSRYIQLNILVLNSWSRHVRYQIYLNWFFPRSTYSI